MTRNNLAVLALLVGFGVYLHASNERGATTAGYYLVALYGSPAEKQALIEDVAREQWDALHPHGSNSGSWTSLPMSECDQGHSVVTVAFP